MQPLKSPPELSTAAGEPDEIVCPVPNSRRWTIVALLFTASVINYFDRATISFALPLISADLHLTPASEGILLSAFFWSYALMQIPIGWCADRFNLRWLYAGAFALWSGAQALMGVARGLTALIFCRILLGLGESIYLPGGSRIVSLLFTRSERGLPVGLFDSGTRTGLFLEGLLIPWMLGRFGWRATFLIVGLTALLWLVPWLLATPARLQGVRPELVAAGPERPAAMIQNPSGMNGWRRFRVFATNRNLIGICLVYFFFDYYWYLLVTWLPNYLFKVRHFTLFQAGIGASLPFLVFGASEPVGGWLADRLIKAGMDETKARKAVVTVAFLTGVFLILAMRVSDARTAVAMLVGACLVGLSTGNLLVMLQSCAPPKDVGLWTGIYNFIGNIAGILAPVVTGFLIQATGSYTPGFVLSAVMLAAGLVCCWGVVGKLKPGPGRSAAGPATD